MNTLNGPAAARRVRPQQGVSLIEILVALLVVSLGVLALAGLLGTASRYGKTSEFRSIATLQASDISDRMRANLAGANLGSYALINEALRDAAPPPAPACANAKVCLPEEMAAQDLAAWQAALFAGLPQGTGHVAYNPGNRTADVWVMWRDPSAVSGAEYLNASDNGRSACPPGFAAADGKDKPRCMFFRVGL
jgi:type IV pilus assembly protein PilV